MDENKLSIRVSVDGRMFPLTVKRSDEESIRKAVSSINDKLRVYRSKYGSGRDSQDSYGFLCMVAIDFATKYQEREKKTSDTELLSQMQNLSAEIEDYINKSQAL